ncbi:hypothetical protein [Cyclobacterium salsum]|uniref:hypothetical protein n=1 Tax=Cyclobacterium salsum TaxID=2666329 RepID=UPI001390CE0E|nr:hypothetical protein [Cyclobacterium salsum]
MKDKWKIFFNLLLIFYLISGCTSHDTNSNLSPVLWMEDYNRYMKAQISARTEAEVAIGENGAITVAHNPLAARAGLEALKQGGNAIDAALTTVSYAGGIDGGLSGKLFWRDGDGLF